MTKYMICFFASLMMIGGAHAEMQTIDVESSVFGLTWKDGNRFEIRWTEDCRIDTDSIMPSRTCKEPAFFFQDNYNQTSTRDRRNRSKTQFPETKLWINGVRIKPREAFEFTYYDSIEKIAQARLTDDYRKGGPLIAKYLIYTSPEESGEWTVLLENNENVNKEYLSLKEYWFNNEKDKKIRIYFFWLVGILGSAVGLLILRSFSIKALLAASEKKRSLAQRSKEKKHEAMVQRITEEETIRREVRKSLEAEEKE